MYAQVKFKIPEHSSTEAIPLYNYSYITYLNMGLEIDFVEV